MAAISGTTAAIIAGVTAAASLAGTAMSISAQQRQAQQQKDAAEYQAKIAQQNQEMAQEQAASVKRQGYDDAQRQRLKAAGIIGTQRAIAGASGITVDTGSNLDLQLDTVEKGELDALAIHQQSLDKSHNIQIQGWNSGQQAQAYAWQADNIDPTAGMIGTALGGIASAGSNFGSALWGGKASSPLTKKGGNIFDSAVAPAFGTKAVKS